MCDVTCDVAGDLSPFFFFFLLLLLLPLPLLPGRTTPPPPPPPHQVTVTVRERERVNSIHLGQRFREFERIFFSICDCPPSLYVCTSVTVWNDGEKQKKKNRENELVEMIVETKVTGVNDNSVRRGRGFLLLCLLSDNGIHVDFDCWWIITNHCFHYYTIQYYLLLLPSTR